VTSTSGGAAPPSATPSPSVTLLAGFADCSATVGRPAQCGPMTPQCWGQLLSVADALYVATPARCSANHVYQTFAAGPLETAVMRKSQLDADPGVRATCRRSLVNRLVAEDQQRDDWEVYAIPAQSAQDEGYFLCVFGKGERTNSFPLSAPR
jgi:hypothetical protein